MSMIDDLNGEADLCLNEGAADVAQLLRNAANHIDKLESALSSATYWWREWMDESRGVHPLDDSSPDEVRADWVKCMALIPAIDLGDIK